MSGTIRLDEAVANLEAASSFRFSISAGFRYFYSYGEPGLWLHSGEGAFAKPDRYWWYLKPQGHGILEVVSVAGKTYCANTSGIRSGEECSLAWGGPTMGSSPYSVIAYFRRFDHAKRIATTVFEGRECEKFAFSVDLKTIAAIDIHHQQIAQKLTGVTGEVLLSRDSKLPLQLRTVIKFKSTFKDYEDKVEMTLGFFGFDEPVEIVEPEAVVVHWREAY